MERKKKPKRPSWKKIGGGSFTLRNRIIKSGQVFSADVEEIPEAFRDVVQLIDGDPSILEKKQITAESTKYELVEEGSTEDVRFNVLNSKTSKPINSELLTKKQAEELLARL